VKALLAAAASPVPPPTHTHETLPPLLEDADAWAHSISPTDVLRQIGSPFADADPADNQDLSYAA